MAERNSSSSGATRGSERGSTASSAGGATSSGTQQNRTQPGTSATEFGSSTAGTGLSSGTGATGAYGTGRTSGTESHGLVGKVRERASAQLTSQKDRALDGLGGVAQAVRSTTQSLRDQQHDTLASYVDQAADQIDRFSRTLRNKDVGELVSDAQRLARRQPALFVGSAFALGLLGARFFKSSSPDRYRSEYGYGEYGGGYQTGTRQGAYGSEWRRGTASTDTTSPASGATYQSPERF